MKLMEEFRKPSPHRRMSGAFRSTQSVLTRVAVQMAVARARAVGHVIDIFFGLRRRRERLVLAGTHTTRSKTKPAAGESSAASPAPVHSSARHCSDDTSDLRQSPEENYVSFRSSPVLSRSINDRSASSASATATEPVVSSLVRGTCWLCSLLPAERRLLRAAVENVERLAKKSVNHCLLLSEELLRAYGLCEQRWLGSVSSIPEILASGEAHESEKRAANHRSTEVIALPGSSIFPFVNGNGVRGEAYDIRGYARGKPGFRVQNEPSSRFSELSQPPSGEPSSFLAAEGSRGAPGDQRSQAPNAFAVGSTSGSKNSPDLTAAFQGSEQIPEAKGDAQASHLRQSASLDDAFEGSPRLEQRSTPPSKEGMPSRVPEGQTTVADHSACSRSGRERDKSFLVVGPTPCRQAGTATNNPRESLEKLFRVAEATLLSRSVSRKSRNLLSGRESDDSSQPGKRETTSERTLEQTLLPDEASAQLVEAFALFKALVQAGRGVQARTPFFSARAEGRPYPILGCGDSICRGHGKTGETERGTADEAVSEQRREREEAARVSDERSDQEAMRLLTVPDVAAFNALLNACAEAGNLALAHTVFTT